MQPEEITAARGAPSNGRRRLVAWGALSALCGVAALCKSAERSQRLTVRAPGTDEAGLLCSPRNAAGAGLRGEYFERENRDGQPLLVRTDGLVGSEAVRALSRQAGGPPARSARWIGWVKAPLPGPYRFHFDHAEARIVVGAVDFSTRALSSSEPPAALEMTAGRFYPIRVELDRLGGPGDAAATLEWTPPHGQRFVVSRAMLFLPMAG